MSYLILTKIGAANAVATDRGLSCSKLLVLLPGDAGAIALSPTVAGVEKVRQAVKTHAAANLTSWI